VRSVRSRGANAAWGTLVLLGLFASTLVRADASDGDVAEELFARGKERLAAGDYADACPLFAQSQQLDPATGTLLALAVCREREGKLASAFAAYSEVVTRARAEKRKDREAAARERAAALEGELSSLTIAGAELAGAGAPKVRLDGEWLAPDQLNRPLRLDGGVKQIDVSAQGKQPWSTSVTLAERGDAITLTIPALEPLTPPVVSARDELPFLYTPPPEPAPRSVPAPREREGRVSPAEWTGIALMASGALSLTIATGYMGRAIHKNNAAQAYCEGPDCAGTAQDNELAAQRATDGAAVSAIVGLGLSAGGLITYILGRQHRPSRRAAARTRASAWASSGAVGAALSGSFR
jgi:hypothetical protein